MKPLLIKFGDNDFRNVFVPLLKSLKEYDLDDDISKETIIDALNIASIGFYAMLNAGYGRPLDIADIEKTRRYLQLTPGMVYYGDEVDAFFKDQEKLSQCDSDCYYICPGQEVGVL